MPHLRRPLAVSRAWLLTAALCLSFPSPAPAFNGYAHKVVAAIAWQRMTPAARKHAAALLRLNPDYTDWVQGVPRKDRAQAAFIRAATWADDIKRRPGYRNDGERPQGPDAALNIGYRDRLQHRYWHYVDRPFSPDGTVLEPAPVPNAATQIAVFRTVLADPRAPKALKSYDLVWLIHLVGDVHQPLHAASRYTQAQPQGDNGGNRVALCARPCRSNLHAFWDDALGDYNGENDVGVSLTKADKMQSISIDHADICCENAWIEESFNIARENVYSDPIGPGGGPYELTPEYKAAAREIVQQRVALAGARLGNLMNNLLR